MEFKTTKIFTDINDFKTLLIRAIDDHNLSVEKEFSVELLTVKETHNHKDFLSGTQFTFFH